MSDHMPDCFLAFPKQRPGGGWYFDGPCICDRLRSCKRRTLNAARDAVVAIDACPECSVDDALAAIDALRGES